MGKRERDRQTQNRWTKQQRSKERQTDRQTDRGRETESQTDKSVPCVCVYHYVQTIQRNIAR